MKKPSTVEIAVVVVIAVTVLALVPVWGDTTWIDPVTGSFKHEESWLVYPYSTEVRRSKIGSSATKDLTPRAGSISVVEPEPFPARS